jgi:hypothetical protein
LRPGLGVSRSLLRRFISFITRRNLGWPVVLNYMSLYMDENANSKTQMIKNMQVIILKHFIRSTRISKGNPDCT